MSNGNLKTLHYSISKIEGTPVFKPRKADQRIGYFTTSYSDYGKYEGDDTEVRYINRWHLEKRDPKLKLSPPKKPIVFYIEHTTPVRYRRWVRKGILNWNKAFENIGIADAIEVRQQDKPTKQHHGPGSGRRSLQLCSLAEQQRQHRDRTKSGQSADRSKFWTPTSF